MKRQISQYKKFLSATTSMSEALFGEAEGDTVLTNAETQPRRVPVETDGASRLNVLSES
ncbi:hypothetical protein [Paraburkholderia sp. UYCP14C]|uniref:hypothetical protein n=1 Tax=Paraburkholderia sp. UYCP14C TaxID=2511130 RepID=UPI00145A00ED|nr:hypothetical protein [Paraburkholderia sp. UYCP14C]